MEKSGAILVSRLKEALPGARVYWERESAGRGLDGALLTAQYRGRQFSLQFQVADDSSPEEPLDETLVDQIVDDFKDFFSRTIYPKEKFTRII